MGLLKIFTFSGLFPERSCRGAKSLQRAYDPQYIRRLYKPVFTHFPENFLRNFLAFFRAFFGERRSGRILHCSGVKRAGERTAFRPPRLFPRKNFRVSGKIRERAGLSVTATETAKYGDAHKKAAKLTERRMSFAAPASHQARNTHTTSVPLMVIVNIVDHHAYPPKAMAVQVRCCLVLRSSALPSASCYHYHNRSRMIPP